MGTPPLPPPPCRVRVASSQQETLDDAAVQSSGRTERPLPSTTNSESAAFLASEDNDIDNDINDANVDDTRGSSRSKRGTRIGRRLRRAGHRGREKEGGVSEGGAAGETDAGVGEEGSRTVAKRGGVWWEGGWI